MNKFELEHNIQNLQQEIYLTKHRMTLYDDIMEVDKLQKDANGDIEDLCSVASLANQRLRGYKLFNYDMTCGDGNWCLHKGITYTDLGDKLRGDYSINQHLNQYIEYGAMIDFSGIIFEVEISGIRFNASVYNGTYNTIRLIKEIPYDYVLLLEDFTKELNGNHILNLLQAHPKYVRCVDNSLMNNAQLTELLRSKPELIDELDLTILEDEDINYLVKTRPYLLSHLHTKNI